MVKARGEKPKEVHEPVWCTVDVVLLTLRQAGLCVALLTRRHAPFAGSLALPGGYIHAEEDADAAAAAARVLQTKLGLARPYLEQLATFSGPERDPRGWSVSIAYTGLISSEALAAASADVRVVPVARLPELPFDHAAIVAAALGRIRNKSLYSSLPVYFCGQRFTLPKLQSVYEAVLGEPINKVSFRRKVEELGMLEPIRGELESGGAHRPAQLYQLRAEYRERLSLLERGIGTRSEPT